MGSWDHYYCSLPLLAWGQALQLRVGLGMVAALQLMVGLGMNAALQLRVGLGMVAG